MQLHRIISVEFRKQKKKGFIFLGLGGILLSIITAYLPSLSAGAFSWHELVSSVLFIFNQILFLFTSYVAGTVFAGEIEADTFDVVRSAPLKSSHILIAKAVMIFTSLAGIICIEVVLTIIAGYILPCGILESGIIDSFLVMSTMLFGLHLVYTPLYIFAALATRKVLGASAVGMLLVLAATVTIGTSLSRFVPSNSATIILATRLGNNAYFEQFLHGISLPAADAAFITAASAIIFLAPLPLIPGYFRRY